MNTSTPWREKLDRFTMLDFNDPNGRLLLANSAVAFVPGLSAVARLQSEANR